MPTWAFGSRLVEESSGAPYPSYSALYGTSLPKHRGIMSDEQLATGFVRRRRFLIATSLALAATGYLGLRIDEVNVLGNKASVEYPERVLVFGYLVWAWALWTYIQWFRDYGAWERTRGMFLQIRDGMLRKALAGVRAPDVQFQNFRTNRTEQANRTQTSDQLGFVSERLKFAARPDGIQRGHNGRLEAICVIEAWHSVFPKGTQSYGNPDFFLTPISRALKWRVSGRALLSLVNSTRYFSEYFAPYIFAVLPIVVLFVHVTPSSAWADPGFHEP
jgi:hypothetical protein